MEEEEEKEAGKEGGKGSQGEADVVAASAATQECLDALFIVEDHSQISLAQIRCSLSKPIPAPPSTPLE